MKLFDYEPAPSFSPLSRPHIRKFTPPISQTFWRKLHHLFLSSCLCGASHYGWVSPSLLLFLQREERIAGNKGKVSLAPEIRERLKFSKHLTRTLLR